MTNPAAIPVEASAAIDPFVITGPQGAAGDAKLIGKPDMFHGTRDTWMIGGSRHPKFTPYSMQRLPTLPP